MQPDQCIAQNEIRNASEHNLFWHDHHAAATRVFITRRSGYYASPTPRLRQPSEICDNVHALQLVQGLPLSTSSQLSNAPKVIPCALAAQPARNLLVPTHATLLRPFECVASAAVSLLRTPLRMQDLGPCAAMHKATQTACTACTYSFHCCPCFTFSNCCLGANNRLIRPDLQQAS
jgi:hypothetical protein